MKVFVYSANWCGYCHALMDWLDDINVKYEEKNGEDEGWVSGYPTVEILNDDGKRLALIEGFDREKIQKAIKAADGK